MSKADQQSLLEPKLVEAESSDHMQVATLPKVPLAATIQQLAKEKTQEAFETIIEIMKDVEVDASTRLAAAKQVLDRGWGRSKIVAEVNSTHVNVHEVLKVLSDKVKEPPKLSMVEADSVEVLQDAASVYE